MNEPPSLTRLARAVVVDAGELQERCRIGGALDNQEQHRSRACCVHRRLIKEQPGLVVTRLNPRREFTALHAHLRIAARDNTLTAGRDCVDTVTSKLASSTKSWAHPSASLPSYEYEYLAITS